MRRLYKLLSWDYETHRGLATDGTKFDHEPITFDIFEQDLDPEYHNHLLLEEVFSAEEAPDRSLHDIVVERGPRAVQPVKGIRGETLTDTDVESIVADMSTVETQAESGDDIARKVMMSPHYEIVDAPVALRYVVIDNLEARLIKLESRVSKLEHLYNVKVDDHK